MVSLSSPERARLVVVVVEEVVDNIDFLCVAVVDRLHQNVVVGVVCIAVVVVVEGMMAVDVDSVGVDKTADAELGRKRKWVVLEGCRLNVYQVVVHRMVQKAFGQGCECAPQVDMVVVAVAAAVQEGSCRMVQVRLVVDMEIPVLVVEVGNIAVAELVEDSLPHNCTLVEEDDRIEKAVVVTLMLPVTSHSLSLL